MPRMNQIGPQHRDRRRHKRAKLSAWRKNLRFGLAHGGDAVGRTYDYLPVHQLPVVSADGHPVLVENRPHPDHYFPVTGEEVMARLRQLPAAHVEGITHLWMRRARPCALGATFGSYSHGPGYAVITLYPWPRSRRFTVGAGKPGAFWRQVTRDAGGWFVREGRTWFAEFCEEGARRFFLDDLLLHEVGHHNDWREWSAANHRQCEEFANQYAADWARTLAVRDEPATTVSADRLRTLRRLLRSAFPRWTPEIAEHRPREGSALTVSVRLVDRRGRPRSRRVWLRPEAIDHLTVDALRRLVRRKERQTAVSRGERVCL